MMSNIKNPSKKNLNIILPLWIPWNQCADFQKKTIDHLMKFHKCIVYLDGDKKSFFKIEKKQNLTLFYPMRIPVKFGLLNVLIDKVNHKVFEFFVKFYVGNVTIIWLFNAELKIFFHIFKNAKVKLYDLVDFSGIESMYEGISDANLIFVNSWVLRRFALQVSKKKVVLVPQGFDLDTFSNTKTFASGGGSHRTVISYIGSINFRFDFHLLHDLIKQNKNCDFVFWGPIQYLDKTQDRLYRTEENIKKLKSYKNVTFGQSDRKGLIKILKKSTFGIIPYNTLLDFNRNCFPMKLLEYFYMGLPVLSTTIDEVGRYEGLAFCSNDSSEWTKFINSIRKKSWPVEKRNKQRAVAQSHSWENKLGKIEKEIFKSLS